MLARLAGIDSAAREVADGPVHGYRDSITHKGSVIARTWLSWTARSMRPGGRVGERLPGRVGPDTRCRHGCEPAAAVRRAGPWHSRPFARRGCCGLLARCGSFGVLGDTAAQRLHEIDHPLRRGNGPPALLNGADDLLGLEVRQ